jgi:hypothetical protein
MSFGDVRIIPGNNGAGSGNEGKWALKQNITLSIEKHLIRKAKILAARKGTSISKLLSQELARLLIEEALYENARKRAVARLKKGYHLGGKILATREELHGRGRGEEEGSQSAISAKFLQYRNAVRPGRGNISGDIERARNMAAEKYHAARAKKGKRGNFGKILAKVPSRKLLPGDELK